jgi:DNA-binding MarR family transcriptional regulator
VEVLQAVRRFRAADAVMRHRAQIEMQINETDLSALRHLIACERGHRVASPKDLSEFLNISSAATAKLLSRLSASGHIRREINPHDGRAQRLFATSTSHAELRHALAGPHELMMQAAQELTADQQAAVVHFLDSMSAIAVMPGRDEFSVDDPAVVPSAENVAAESATAESVAAENVAAENVAAENAAAALFRPLHPDHRPDHRPDDRPNDRPNDRADERSDDAPVMRSAASWSVTPRLNR